MLTRSPSLSHMSTINLEEPGYGDHQESVNLATPEITSKMYGSSPRTNGLTGIPASKPYY